MFSFLLFAFILIAHLYLGVLVYNINPKGRDNKVFVLLTISVVMWIIANYLQNELIPFSLRQMFLYLDFIAALMFSYFGFLFCFYFLEDKKISKKFNVVIICFIIVFVISILNDLVIYNINIDQTVIRFSYGIIFPLYAGFILFFLISGSLLLVIKCRRFNGLRKLQILYVLYGFFLASLVGAVINLFFQDKLSIEWFRVGSYGTIFFIGFTSYAIIKHHLFDIRSIIQRGLVYSGLASVLISFYLATVFIISIFFQRQTQTTVIISAGLAVLVGVFGISTLEKIFRKFTDRFFYKEKYDYQEAIYLLSKVFNKNLNLEILLREFSSNLTQILKVKYVRVIIPQKKKVFDEYGKLRNIKMDFNGSLIKIIEKHEIDIFLASSISAMIKEEEKSGQNKDKIKALQIAKKESWKFGISVFVPILLNKKLLGFAILGEKKSGDLFTPDDLNLLRTISSQAAVALEKSQLYEQVKVYSKKLEEKVKERTEKIKGLQTEQKQMMLEIAHGLQTPLTIIKGELSSFRKTWEGNEKLLSFEKSIDRISTFIYDMLQLANLNSEVQPDKLELLNLSELLLELIEEFEIVTSDKNISIHHTIEPGVYIKGDKTRLEEMVSNLVSNSVKYMKADGEKNISIKLYKKNKQAFLTIKDTGIGIKKEDLPKLFTRFFRIKDEQGKNKGGTGLGLAICKKIVEMHKGKIKAESKVNKGTKFIIEIPVV